MQIVILFYTNQCLIYGSLFICLLKNRQTPALHACSRDAFHISAARAESAEGGPTVEGVAHNGIFDFRLEKRKRVGEKKRNAIWERAAQCDY